MDYFVIRNLKELSHEAKKIKGKLLSADVLEIAKKEDCNTSTAYILTDEIIFTHISGNSYVSISL